MNPEPGLSSISNNSTKQIKEYETLIKSIFTNSKNNYLNTIYNDKSQTNKTQKTPKT